MTASGPPFVRCADGRGRVAVASTWCFGLVANRAARSSLAAGSSALDAVVAAAEAVERDPEVDSAGYGGLPNAEGVVELDAGVMDGTALRAGAVVALREIRTPTAVARRVMEQTPHAVLAGEGALRFALQQGFRREETLAPAARDRWLAWAAGPCADAGHDTVGVVAVDPSGRIASACSTSGLRWKRPGRVGDSPLIGCGLYCDDEVGGAVATGVGEDIVRVCGSFLVVEGMRRGLGPAEAIRETLARILRRDPTAADRQIAFVALRRDGACAGGCTRAGFQVAAAFADGGPDELVEIAPRESPDADPVA